MGGRDESELVERERERGGGSGEIESGEMREAGGRAAKQEKRNDRREPKCEIKLIRRPFP